MSTHAGYRSDSECDEPRIDGPGDHPDPMTAAEQAAALLERCTFPDADSPLDCAVSGGADSSALLILATSAGCRVTAHHVDHGLRSGSHREAEQVAALADRFGARFVAHTAHIEPGSNLEARARAARRELLPSSAATGHTLDDRAETVLINLMRGAGRLGLSPMRDGTRHPIIGLRRTETRALCDTFGVVPLHDPSNDDPAFVRNRVRHELLPLLADISRRDPAPVLDRQAGILADEDRFLDELASSIDPTDARALADAPVVLARRALRTFIAEGWSIDHPPSVGAVDRALDVALGNATSCDLEGGHRIHRTGQKLRLLSSLTTVSDS